MQDLNVKEINEEIKEIEKQIEILNSGIKDTKDDKEKESLISKKKELENEKKEYSKMLKEISKDEKTKTKEETNVTSLNGKKYKGYFRSQDKMFACVLKPADVIYDSRGNKIIKKKALVVDFKNFRYIPKTEEEKEELLKFSEKYPEEVKYISVASQIKRDELDQKKQEIEQEINKKYADVEEQETASIKRGLA